jgi:hypothetical protein
MIKGIGFAVLVTALWLSPSVQANAQNSATGAYPWVASEKYLMADSDAEIALARTAAPKSISTDAEIMVLDQQGYKTAVKGTNGFICLVQRSWTAGTDAPEFWNPKILSPGCFNALAAHSYLVIQLAKARLVMSGGIQTAEAIHVAIEKQHLPAIEPGAMCYMMSKQGYLGDNAGGPWHPHLMFFVAPTDDKSWGANLDNSPVLAVQDPSDHATIFLIPVSKWSDGTADSN